MKESTSDRHLGSLEDIGLSPKDFTSASRDQVLIEELKDEAVLVGAATLPFNEQAYYDTLITKMEKHSSENKALYDELIGEKRKHNELLAASASAKRQKWAKCSWFHVESFSAEEGRSPNFSKFKLPLYTPTAVEQGFNKFASLILTDGLHDASSELTEAAILMMHTTHTLFRAAHKEAKMLADKEKYELLVREHEMRKKEYEGKIMDFERVEAEITEKDTKFDTMQPIFEHCQLDFEQERTLKQAFLKKFEGEQREHALTKARRAKEQRKGVTQETALRA